jgi:hypothetical protein
LKAPPGMGIRMRRADSSDYNQTSDPSSENERIKQKAKRTQRGRNGDGHCGDQSPTPAHDKSTAKRRDGNGFGLLFTIGAH